MSAVNTLLTEMQTRGDENAYIYFMLLLKLGCMLSGRHLKMYMTSAQLRLANTGHAFALIFSRTSSGRSCVGMVGMGTDGDGVETARRPSASMTRAKTKMTIWICFRQAKTEEESLVGWEECHTCLFTLPCLPLPKTA
jgi:hypothetical protein